MGYEYAVEKKHLFDEQGQEMFLKIRDNAHRLLKEAGAFKVEQVWRRVTGSSWQMLACVDRMVEMKEIKELKRECWAQHRVFVAYDEYP